MRSVASKWVQLVSENDPWVMNVFIVPFHHLSKFSYFTFILYPQIT
jgi:hypothetical protein